MPVVPSRPIRIALLGNPNAGKTTLFNALTGLHHKTGNFPGVTVEKKTGEIQFNGQKAEIVDLPGIYSINFKSSDEQIAFHHLFFSDLDERPDKIVVVSDATNLKRSLLLLTQLIDLKFPVVLCLNMIDQLDKAIDVEDMALKLDIPICPTNARTGEGILPLMEQIFSETSISVKSFYQANTSLLSIIDEVRKVFRLSSPFTGFMFSGNLAKLPLKTGLPEPLWKAIEEQNWRQLQAEETVSRYEMIAALLTSFEVKPKEKDRKFSETLDNILTHPVYGLLSMLVVLLIIFQSIFSLASFPMDLIEGFFGFMNAQLKILLPSGFLTDLLVDGILAGLGGVLVFVPQIALLFGFISLLEESGYMARVSFLTDRLMQRFGMNGKSIIPLVGGFACAVPSIMSTRTISNRRERLLTILVIPLMSCSARLPVYTLLTSLAVPNEKLWGFVSLQGLVMFGLYCLGFVMGLLVSLLLSRFVNEEGSSYFMLEMPLYRIPKWKNVGRTIVSKSGSFVTGAGKVIIAVSVILWVLSSFGPGESFQKIEAKYSKFGDVTRFENQIQAEKLEQSYAGHLGKAMEPFIQPLGYDWKIGVSLITSFAAREVFVGTMTTIYSLGTADFEEKKLINVMKSEVDPQTGKPRYGIPTAFSLLVFYAFAMQCISTLSVTYKETGKLRWAIIQLVGFTGLAYLSAWLVYTLLS